MAKHTSAPSFRANDQIRVPRVRLIDDQGQQHGVVDTQEAKRMARERDLDLVEVAPNDRPPVCRIMDYGKFKYQQKKNVKKHHEQQLKEVRLRPKTDDNDREIKRKKALRFLSKGDKVQFRVKFRGRERAHRELAASQLLEIVEHFGDLVKVERSPAMDGRDMLMILSPQKKAFDKLMAETPNAIPTEAEVEGHDDDDDDHDDGDDHGDVDVKSTQQESSPE